MDSSNHTEHYKNNFIILSLSLTHTHTHTNTTACQLNVLLNVIYQLLVTSKRLSNFPTANNVKVKRNPLSQCLYV